MTDAERLDAVATPAYVATPPLNGLAILVGIAAQSIGGVVVNDRLAARHRVRYDIPGEPDRRESVTEVRTSALNLDASPVT